MSIVREIRMENPNSRIIDEAVDILSDGGIICYPTDTIYGLGVDLSQKKALKKIARIKNKPKLPLSFICNDFSMISEYAHITNHVFKILKRCLPGGFTFVLPATNKVPDLMLYRQHTVGIRIPDCKVCRAIVENLGHPVLSTSIPAEEEEILNNAYKIELKYGNDIDMIIDGGVLYFQPSTVVSLINDEIVILREGKGDLSLLY